MSEIILAIIGAIIIYTWVHAVILMVKKSFSERTNYEKSVTIVAIITAALIIINSL